MKINLVDLLKIPVEDLKEKVLVFPTDTVYGIGALWQDKQAIAKIYDIKKREPVKPLAILIHDFSQIESFVEINYSNTLNLVNKYWPGDVTFIFKKKDNLDYPYQTIAFRVPKSDIALKIVKQFGPIATTSVNYSGETPINNLDVIDEMFSARVDYLVTDQANFSAVSSTVVDISTSNIKIIRQGNQVIDETNV